MKQTKISLHHGADVQSSVVYWVIKGTWRIRRGWGREGKMELYLVGQGGPLRMTFEARCGAAEGVILVHIQEESVPGKDNGQNKA